MLKFLGVKVEESSIIKLKKIVKDYRQEFNKVISVSEIIRLILRLIEEEKVNIEENKINKEVEFIWERL